MTKKQMVEELERRMVICNNEYEKWAKKFYEEQDESLREMVAYCYGKAIAYEEAWKLVSGM